MFSDSNHNEKQNYGGNIVIELSLQESDSGKPNSGSVYLPKKPLINSKASQFSSPSGAGEMSIVSSQLNINKVVRKSKVTTQPGLKMNRTRNFSEFKKLGKTLESSLQYQKSTDNICQTARFQSKHQHGDKFSISPRPKSNLRSPSSKRRKLRVKFIKPQTKKDPQLGAYNQKVTKESILDTNIGSFVEGTRKGALKNALMNVNSRLLLGFDSIQELFADGIEEVIQEINRLIKGNSHNLTSVEKDLSRSILKLGWKFVQTSDNSEATSRVLLKAFEFQLIKLQKYA